MPNVDLVATKDFSYRTRRLKAGDPILNVPERDARVLVAIKKAEHQRTPGKVAPPPPELATRAMAATVEKPKRATRRRTPRKSTVKKS